MKPGPRIAMWAWASLFLLRLKYAKLATKCRWMYGYFLESLFYTWQLKSVIMLLYSNQQTCLTFDLLTLTLSVSYGAPGVQFSGQHASFAAVTHICFLAVQVTYRAFIHLFVPINRFMTCCSRYAHNWPLFTFISVSRAQLVKIVLST